MNQIQEISKLSDRIPIEALQNIHSRVTDWLAGVGNHDDPYIHQQLRYAQNLARSEGNG
ncbi:DUF6877 family protein [Sporosarcina sp. FSL W7-1349]|uniref:DUF6877 family protein n=1 Tax=Sporosarcina sp. FSL W7-1349 TaxID=2921561 RepID=UPI0030F6BC94